MVIKRLLLNKLVEVYAISEKFCGKSEFYMIFYDYRRPSRFEDFSFIPGMNVEDFSPNGNYIQALVIHENEMTDEEQDYMYELASGFLECKDDCDWTIKHIQMDFTDLRVIETNPSALVIKVNEILKSMDPSIPEVEIEIETFKYLIQE